MDKKVNINYTKINKSIQTVESINELLTNSNLVSYFEEMERYFREINFEHANCLNYKESFDAIYGDIDEIKRKMQELEVLLVKASNTNKEDVLEVKDEKKKGFFKSLVAKINVDELDIKDTIPIQNPVDNPETSYDNSTGGINTVPIGVAIGTAGVIGSIGTVALNEIYDSNRRRPKKKFEYNDYNVSDTFNNDDDYKGMLSDDYYGSATLIDGGVKPYVANRSNRATDTVYNMDDNAKLPDYDDSKDDESSDNE